MAPDTTDPSPWDQFWVDPWGSFWEFANTNLGATIIGGLLVALIAAVVGLVVRKTRRPRARGGLPPESFGERLVVWLVGAAVAIGSIRVTTSGRIAAKVDAGRREGQAAGVKYGAQDAMQKVQPMLDEANKRQREYHDMARDRGVHIADLQTRYEDSLSASKSQKERIKELEVEVASAKETLSATQFELDTLRQDSDAPALPRPKPRWRLFAGSADDKGIVTYTLKNSMPLSVARHARVDRIKGSFTISDAGFWEDLSGVNEGIFHGHLDGDGQWAGATIRLEWYDEENAWNSWDVTIRGSGDTPF